MGCGASSQAPAASQPYFSPDALLASIESDAVWPLKGSWIVKLHKNGGKLARRQDLPKEAFWTHKELRDLVGKIGNHQHLVHGGIDWGLLFVALSYRWLSQAHPDPDGYHLKRVATAASLYLKKDDEWGSPLVALFQEADLEEAPDFALFWDFGSLVQKGPPTVEGGPFVERTPDEVRLFKSGLGALPVWYGHSFSVVWMQTELPEGFAETMKKNDPPLAETYEDSGWCFVEASMTGALKMGHRRLDLGRAKLGRATPDVFTYGGGWVPETKLDSVCKATRDPPMTPEEFCTALQKKLFTSGADSEVVKGIYSSFFDKAVPAAKQLIFSGVSWGDTAALGSKTEMQRLADVLPRFTSLTALDLSRNSLGSKGGALLGDELRRRFQLGAAAVPLKRLTVTGKYNQVNIDGDGATTLAAAVLEACPSLEHFGPVPAMELRMGKATALELENSGLGPVEGMVIGALLKSAAGLKVLVLAHNKIGDSGAIRIADGIKTHRALETLNLEDCSVGVDGAVALGDALMQPSSLKALVLAENLIGDQGARAISEGVKTQRALETLSLEGCGIGAVGGTALASGLTANAGALKACDLWRNEQMGDAVEQLLRGAVAGRVGFELVLPSRALITGGVTHGEKVIVLTGATGEIGGAVARGLLKTHLKMPLVARLVLIVKDESEKDKALDTTRHDDRRTATGAGAQALDVDVLVADLAVPASIASCCARIRREYQRVDVLINCAAVASKTRVRVDRLGRRDSEDDTGALGLLGSWARGLLGAVDAAPSSDGQPQGTGSAMETDDGLELQFATNVLGSFVLMRELLPAFSRGARVVLVASQLANGLKLDDLQSHTLQPYHPIAVYSASKQAVRMLAAEAPKHGFSDAGVVVSACHPGVVTSELLQALGIATGPDRAEMAAQTPLKLALGAPPPESGTYHVDKKPHPCKFATDVGAREELWRRCDELANKCIRESEVKA